MPKSTDPRDYQRLPVTVAAMAKAFTAGDEIAPHAHERDQLIHAVLGTMRVSTASAAWIVPPDRAVYIPADVVHALSMHGAVEMRTLYIVPDARRDLPRAPRVLGVSALLRALILALVEEPAAYDPAGRAGHVATLILDEIVRATPLELAVPMPADPRLRRLCEALLRDPSRGGTMDAWAASAGASERTLARLFARECGMPFAVWRQRVRLHSALAALARNEPIAAVARANGYASASAFTAAFRKTLGMTPRMAQRRAAAPHR